MCLLLKKDAFSVDFITEDLELMPNRERDYSLLYCIQTSF